MVKIVGRKTPIFIYLSTCTCLYDCAGERAAGAGAGAGWGRGACGEECRRQERPSPSGGAVLSSRRHTSPAHPCWTGEYKNKN